MIFFFQALNTFSSPLLRPDRDGAGNFFLLNVIPAEILPSSSLFSFLLLSDFLSHENRPFFHIAERSGRPPFSGPEDPLFSNFSSFVDKAGSTFVKSPLYVVEPPSSKEEGSAREGALSGSFS